MGLLDLFNTYEGQQGLGLLAAASARSDGAGFGQRLQEGLGMADNWKRKKAADEFQQMQMADHLARIEEAKAQRAQQVTDSAAVRGAFTPMSGGDAMANGQGPTIANAANIGQVQPFDPRRFLAQNPQASLAALKQAMEMKAAIDPKKNTVFTLLTEIWFVLMKRVLHHLCLAQGQNKLIQINRSRLALMVSSCQTLHIKNMS